MEENGLIAKWMKFVDGGNYWATNHKWPYIHPSNGHRFYPGELDFDRSWDWIMGVVEKIEELGYGTSIYRVWNKSYTHSFTIFDRGQQTKVYGRGVSNENKLQAVYHGVVEFIKWHNSQNENKL